MTFNSDCSLTGHQTNALRLVLLPISIVRLVTDPIADLIISATNQAKKSILPIRQEPPKHGLALRIKALVQAVMSRLAGREPPPAARQTLSAYLKIRFEAYRDLTRVASLKVAEAIQTRWYLMASQDTELDRVLCIALGYAVVLAGAAFYLRHSQNQQARNGMRAVRDAVKQQFVLFKVSYAQRGHIACDSRSSCRQRSFSSLRSFYSQRCVVSCSTWLPSP